MSQEPDKSKNKNHRGSASQFFVAGELCRRGLVAVVTMGNTPNTDILCSNINGTKFLHIQVKTYVPTVKGGGTVSVGLKAEKYFGENFIWVLGGIPSPNSDVPFEYYIIPSREMSKNIAMSHKVWMETPGAKGQPHNDNTMRTVRLPPKTDIAGWSVEQYKNRWDLIEEILK